jgi:hypothetical protein
MVTGCARVWHEFVLHNAYHYLAFRHLSSLADTSIKDWHRAQRKIECGAITRLARRDRRAEEPPRLSSTTHYFLQETGQAPNHRVHVLM